MLSFNDTEINTLLIAYFWPWVRILGVLAADPIFGTRNIPSRIKIILAIALTVLVAPLLPPMPQVALMSSTSGLIVVQQFMIGVIMGFILRLAVSAVEIAGALASLQMGLGFAMLFDPQNASQVPALSRILTTLTYLLFLAFDGHLLLLSTLIDSFRLLPISATPLHAVSFKLLAESGGHMFSLGLWLALPPLASLLIINLAIGMMTRAAPQFNIFSFGFPLTLLSGLVSMYLVLPYFQGAITHIYQDAFVTMHNYFKAAGG